MKNAMESLERVSSDERMLEIHRAREKSRRDLKSKMIYAEKKAIEKVAKEMIKDGMDLEKVALYSNLSVEEVNEIKENLDKGLN